MSDKISTLIDNPQDDYIEEQVLYFTFFFFLLLFFSFSLEGVHGCVNYRGFCTLQFRLICSFKIGVRCASRHLTSSVGNVYAYIIYRDSLLVSSPDVFCWVDAFNPYDHTKVIRPPTVIS